MAGACLYLASRSPRRRALLDQLGIEYRVVSVAVEEVDCSGAFRVSHGPLTKPAAMPSRGVQRCSFAGWRVATPGSWVCRYSRLARCCAPLAFRSWSGSSKFEHLRAASKAPMVAQHRPRSPQSAINRSPQWPIGCDERRLPVVAVCGLSKTTESHATRPTRGLLGRLGQ